MIAAGRRERERARRRPSALPRWTTQLSFIVITIALVLLLVLPIIVRLRSHAIRRQATDLADPARDVTEDIERDVAVQVAAARGFQITGDRAFLRNYDSSSVALQSSFRRLSVLAKQLGPQVAAAVAELHAATNRWQGETLLLIRTPPATAAARARVEASEPLFQATIAAAAHVDAAIGQAVQRRRQQAAAIDTDAAIITGVLVVLVLVSVLLLIRLGRQLRRLAEESRRRAEHEERLRRDLQSAMESRGRLIRGFSHDVRNPLGAADGYAQLLEGGVYGDLQERQLESLARIRRSIGAAVVLTNDLLDLARLEAGQLEFERRSVDVCALVAETAEEYGAQAEAASLHMELKCPGKPLHIVSDPRRIRQVLGNLLSNAIKYTPEGGNVIVRVAAHTGMAPGPPHPGDWVSVSVADTGIGIQPEQIARIFNEFARAGPETTRGVGLGLAISRRLAHALGGDITLESQPGVGSTFTLWLPSRRATDAADHEATPA